MATKNGKQGEYGKDSTPNPAVSKYARLSERGAGVPVSWKDVSGPLIKGALAQATDDGCALIFSKTTDGGALSLTILDGARREKLYAKSIAQAEALLSELIALGST